MSEAPRRRLPQWVRWLHIYISMIAFGVTMLFAVTGFTLNHVDWFESGEPSVRSLQGELPMPMLRGEVDKLAVAEQLRHAHRLKGMVTDFEVDELELTVLYKGPGYSADVVVDREAGTYRVEEARRSVMAILDDLHKGRDCGPVWSLVIDVSAVLLTLLSITGLWLLLYLKKRRRSGIVLGFVGGMVAAMSYVFGVM